MSVTCACIEIRKFQQFRENVAHHCVDRETSKIPTVFYKVSQQYKLFNRSRARRLHKCDVNGHYILLYNF